MKKILLATNNFSKLSEFSEFLKKFKFQIINNNNLNYEKVIEENNLTFIENAILKARHASLTTNFPVIAEDSGISVDALQGLPGIYSARFAGKKASDKDNVNKLLHVMKNNNKRKAQFHCIVVYLRNFYDPLPKIFQGTWHGILTNKPIGNNGFGYDSIFYDVKLKLTAAQLNTYQKNLISHRGQALKKLLKFLLKNV